MVVAQVEDMQTRSLSERDASVWSRNAIRSFIPYTGTPSMMENSPAGSTRVSLNPAAA